MKKITLMCIVVCIAVMLSGCKSSDYKKASGLMDSGSYEEAIAIFEELGDYKDSADLITDCQYGSAVAIYDSGDFKTSIEKFKALDDYKYSEEYVKNAMWEILYDYYPYGVGTEGTVIGTTTSGKNLYAFAISSTEERDGLIFQGLVSGSADYTLVLFVYNGNNEGIAMGMCTYESKNDMGTAKFNISKYKEDYEFDWDLSRDYSISNASKSQLDELDESTKSVFNSIIDLMMKCVNDEFKDNGLGFTLADIGFTSY